MTQFNKYKLGDTAEITSSKRIFLSDYVSTGIPFYRSKEIIEKANGEKVSSELYITKDKYFEIKKRFGSPKDGDLLISAVGERAGIPYCVRNDGDFYFKDGNLIWFRDFIQEINSKFLYYFLRSDFGQNILSSAMIGSAQRALTIIGLKNVEVPFPVLTTQTRIASILSSLDDKIELNRRTNHTLEQIAQTLFKKYFVDDIDPENLPEGWSYEKVNQLFDISIGRTPPRVQHEWFSTNSEDVMWISIKDMGTSGVYISETSEYLTKLAVKNFNIPVIPDNTVVLSFKLTVGRVAITTERMLSNEAIAHFIQKSSTYLTSEYVYLFLRNFDYDSLGSTSSIATAVNSQTIKGINILRPSKEIVEKFSSIVISMFNKIKTNQEEIKSLSKLRDLLLPKLISGEIEVNAAEKELAN